MNLDALDGAVIFRIHLIAVYFGFSQDKQNQLKFLIFKVTFS